jgi:hypothetical protein
MTLFAGYCLGKLMQEPGRDVGSIVDEFNKDFNL